MVSTGTRRKKLKRVGNPVRVNRGPCGPRLSKAGGPSTTINKERPVPRTALRYRFSSDLLKAGVSQPIKPKIRPGGWIVGSITLGAVGCIATITRHHNV
jgi:hypothetical protein